jgi:DNA replication protein DnaC
MKNERKFMLREKITAKRYAELFIEIATSKIAFSDNTFNVDNDNKEVINQLYYYLIEDPRFKGEHYKGIILIGTIGTGKTLIMETFTDIFNLHASKIIINVPSRDVVEVSKKKGQDYLFKRPAYIDDIGKEQVLINDYGTKSKPMEDIVNERYKREALTLATSNLKFEDMPYSNHTIDRMRQMFNVFVLAGKSRRI